MPYIIGLLIILGLVFSSFSGINFGSVASNLLNGLKDKITATIFPKSDSEILIENLLSDYDATETLFSQAATNILNSKDVSAKDKAAVKQALETMKKSKKDLVNLGNLEKKDQSIAKSVINKILNLDSGSSSSSSSSSSSPSNSATNSPSVSGTQNIQNASPTIIPPYCHLECTQQ